VLSKKLLKVGIGVLVFLLILLGVFIGISQWRKQEPTKEAMQKITISDVLLLNKNLKDVLNVYREIKLKQTKDSLAASEVWFVPNGMSIPNYMLRASREVERCNGKIHWMREIRDGQAALLKYEGEQGVYPVTEVRIVDSVWLPNSSKLAVVLAVNEQNKLLKNKPELLENISFDFSLLIPSSRNDFLEAGKKLNVKIIPRIPMEGKSIYNTEKKAQISIGLSEKELSKMLDEVLKKFDNASGFASFYGEDFLIHPASVEKLINVLYSKKLWFWDLSTRGIASLSLNECSKKELSCRKNYLEAESEEQIKAALRTARINGSAILLFELTEKSIELLKKLPEMAKKQGTSLVSANEVF
jgi:polysaccharide deacetylase 2 family uncharacterized protein YibQ